MTMVVSTFSTVPCSLVLHFAVLRFLNDRSTRHCASPAVFNIIGREFYHSLVHHTEP